MTRLILLLTLLLSVNAVEISSRTAAAIYINGHRVISLPPNKAFTLPSLRPNDIVIVLAKLPRRNVKPGIATSEPLKWRADFVSRKITTRDWGTKIMYPDVCLWSMAGRLSKRLYWPVGKPPKKSLARFRYVQGDEQMCAKDVAIVTAAASDQAWLFWNGKHIGDVISSKQAIKRAVKAKWGDVLAVKAMDVKKGRHAYGLAVDVEFRGKKVVTKPGGKEWRMAGMYTTANPADMFAFMRPGYVNCSWGFGVKPKYEPKVLARGFPFGDGGRYVWADDAQHVASVVFGRMVLGGVDECVVTGLEEGPGECACDVVDSAEGSVCWYFMDWRKHSCDWRPCEPKYVCSGRDIKPGEMVCVKKQLEHRIVKREGEDGVCRLKKDPHYIWIPYERS